MKKFIIFALLLLFAITNSISTFASTKGTKHEIDTLLVKRPLKEFDITAFCAYSEWHPQDFLVDNNWNILCAFHDSGTVQRLKDLGIKYNKSQLMLLEIGGLLKSESINRQTFYTSQMPIFDKNQTEDIRKESKHFADSLFIVELPLFKEVIKEIKAKGWANNTYSLIFSYLLDGCIWQEGKLPCQKELGEYATWSGSVWAMYNRRESAKIGTNSYGSISMNWSNNQIVWPSTRMMLDFANEIETGTTKIKDKALVEKLASWNLVNKQGDIIVPIIHPHENNNFNRLCDELSTKISGAVIKYCDVFASRYKIENVKTASVIFYHEVMWDMLYRLETEHLITKPEVLNGLNDKQQVGHLIFIKSLGNN